MKHVWATVEVHIELTIADPFADPGITGRIILKWICKKWNVEDWTKSLWLRIGTGG
jgi:hypothetical protein